MGIIEDIQDKEEEHERLIKRIQEMRSRQCPMIVCKDILDNGTASARSYYEKYVDVTPNVKACIKCWRHYIIEEHLNYVPFCEDDE